MKTEAEMGTMWLQAKMTCAPRSRKKRAGPPEGEEGACSANLDFRLWPPDLREHPVCDHCSGRPRTLIPLTNTHCGQWGSKQLLLLCGLHEHGWARNPRRRRNMEACFY